MRMTVQNKLYGGFGITVLLLLVVSAVGFVGLGSVTDATADVKTSAELDDAVMSMQIALLDGMELEAQALMTSDTTGLRDEFDVTVESFDGAFQTLMEKGNASVRETAESADVGHESFQVAARETLDLIDGSGANTAVLNISGRQRMLSQRMSKEVLLVAAGNLSVRDSLQATSDEFNATLGDLINGNAERGLPAALGDVPAQLATVSSIWEPMHEQVKVVLTAAPDSPQFASAVSYINGNNVSLLVESNVAVGLYATQLDLARANRVDVTVPAVATILESLRATEVQVEAFGDAALASADSTSGNSSMLLISIAVAATAIAAALAWFIAKGIVGGVRKMVAAAEGISQGDLEQDITVSTNDEIGDMAAGFGEMVEYLNEMASAANNIAQGDLGTEVTPRSEVDALGNAFVQMQGYLSGTAATAEAIAGGDLTVDVTPQSERDALGVAFSSMVTQLRSTIGQVRDIADSLGSAKDDLGRSADQAASATQEVASTTSQVADGSSQQATSVQETSKSMDQLDQSAQRLEEQAERDVAQAADRMAVNAQEATNGVGETVERASAGADRVQATVDGIARIKTSIDGAADEIAGLGERSQEIGKIVAVIEDIAAQTNLLALNAAIEAARAGEQGRGFAVVADEVRQLAERVSSATKEIAELIGGVQQGVDGTVRAMEEGAAEMDAGTAAAAEAAAALTAILGSVDEVKQQIDEIASGSEQLKGSSAEMLGVVGELKDIAGSSAESVTNIASIAQENAAGSEQVSAAAEEMTAQVDQVSAAAVDLGRMSDELSTEVSAFRLEGSDASRHELQAVPTANEAADDAAEDAAAA